MKDTQGIGVEGPRAPVVALIGNPNCGKSAIFNALTGARQTIGNWPGVTVEKKEGSFSVDGLTYNVIDLPGTYNLKGGGEDEKAAVSYILSGEYDLIVNVLDAGNLERNLYLTTQLIEMRKPILFVLNMIDIASSRDLIIDEKELRKRLSAGPSPESGAPIEYPHLKEGMRAQVRDNEGREAPLISVAATKGGAGKILRKAVVDALVRPAVPRFVPVYPDPINAVVNDWSGRLDKTTARLGVGSRWTAIKILERESGTNALAVELGELTPEEISSTQIHLSKELSHNPQTVLAEGRYAAVKSLLNGVIARGDRSAKKTTTDRIDAIFLNRFLGVPIFLGMMYVMFWIVAKVGAAFVDFFDILGAAVFVKLPEMLLNMANAPDWLVAILANGIGDGLHTVGTFIPYVGAMFLCLAILEDSGYMARAAFIMDRCMRMIGLPGRSFVPLIVGFGCSVPAIMATRFLENKRDRVMTVFMSPLMSCSARLPVYVLLGAAFFGANSNNMIFSIYLLGIVLAILTGLLISKTLTRGKSSHFVMELPPYHVPKPRAIMKSTWKRLSGFTIRAGRVLIIAMAILGALNTLTPSGKLSQTGSDSILALAGRSVSPIFAPFGVEKDNWPASVALFSGMFAKESIIGTLTALYGQADNKAETEEAEKFVFLDDLKSSVVTVGENLKGLFVPAAVETDPDEATVINSLRRHFSLGKWQVYAYLIFILLYVPCVTAMATALREIGWFYWVLLMLYLTALSWALATLFFQLTMGHSPLWIGVSLGILAFIVIIFRILGTIKPTITNGDPLRLDLVSGQGVRKSKKSKRNCCS